MSKAIIPIILSIFAAENRKYVSDMHFVFSYDLGAEGQRRAEIEAKIQEIIAPYKYTKRLYNFYIIHIEVNSEWDTFLSKMSDLAMSVPEKFHFIISPAMNGGVKYNGILPKGEWDEINELSK